MEAQEGIRSEEVPQVGPFEVHGVRPVGPDSVYFMVEKVGKEIRFGLIKGAVVAGFDDIFSARAYVDKVNTAWLAGGSLSEDSKVAEVMKKVSKNASLEEEDLMARVAAEASDVVDA